MDPKLADIIQFLNAEKIRATYGAVAGVLGVVPRSMGARLGPHNRAASWIVNGDTGLPTNYSAQNMHPQLLLNTAIIRTSDELIRRIKGKWGQANKRVS